MEKTLTLVCSVCALLSIGLLIGLIVVAVNNNSDDVSALDDICLTKTCIAESSLLLSQMNLTADPYDLETFISERSYLISRFPSDAMTFMNSLVERFYR
jgi:hypothetical protein